MYLVVTLRPQCCVNKNKPLPAEREQTKGMRTSDSAWFWDLLKIETKSLSNHRPSILKRKKRDG